MKLLSVKTARCIWLLHISDLNPEGFNLREIIPSFLINTYNFRNLPSENKPPDQNKSLKFEYGEFRRNDNDIPILVNLTIHDDGLVADTLSSTLNSEKFLEDIDNRFAKLFNSPSPQTLVKEKLYLSEVYVSTDKDLNLINKKLKIISEYLSNSVEQGDRDFQFGGMSFWANPEQKKHTPAPFRLERAIDASFRENRYYSIAPLQTDKHLELLEKLEKILS